MPIPVGSQAPDVTLKTSGPNGFVDVRIADHVGKDVVVVLFFPAAFTGVCTQELCDMSAGLGSYRDMGAVVYGISADTPFAHAGWAKANNITVTLLSDRSLAAAEAFDVVLPDFIGLGPTSARAAFVIDKTGTVRYSEQTESPGLLPNFDAIKQTVQSLS